MPVIETAATHLPMDWVIVGLFSMLIAIDALRSGTARAAAFALAAPLSLFVASEISYTVFIGSEMQKISSPYVQGGIFAAFFVIFFILVYLMIPKSSGSGSLPLQALLAGLASGVVLAVVWLQ